jgi:hypothetical protein
MKNVVLLCSAVAIAAVVALTAKSDPPATPREPISKAATAESAPPAAPATQSSLSGEVRETIDVAQYTYLRLSTKDRGELWAAVSKVPISVGSYVSIVDAARMTNFESATLKRTFDVIYFGNLGSPGRPSSKTAALPPGHPSLEGQDVTNSPHGSAATPPLSSAVKVTPATGRNAYAIAALFAQRASLAGKPARVRGQIVKATPVQGVTYYRISDGSSDEPASAQLVVSSTAKANSGQVVTFEGQVRTDVDVGIGFKYPVMLQDAQLVD